MAIDVLKRKRGTVFRTRVVLPSGKRISKCFRRKIDAVQFEAKVVADARGFEQSQKKRILFQDFVDLYMENHCSNMEFTSKEKYLGALNHEIKPRFQNRWMDTITTFDVAEYTKEINQSAKGQATKNFLYVTFKSVLKKAFEWGFIDRLPGVGTKGPRKSPPRTEFWNSEEVTQFLDGMRGHPRLEFYLVALNTGMRAGEILGLKKEVVLFDRNLIVIKRSFCQKLKIIKETTKTHRERFISMNSATKMALRTMVQRTKDDILFCPETLGCSNVTHLARVFRNDCKRVGVRAIRFHDLRHTFATQFVSKGGSIFHLANILGHSTTSMTARYAHFCEAQAFEASQVVTFDVPQDAKVLRMKKRGHGMVRNSKQAT